MSAQAYPVVKRIGLLLGPLLSVGLLLAPTPEGMTPEGQRVGAVALLMGVWWITEAIPIPATSLAPLALFPLLGIMDGKALAVSYGDQNIFLFAGGFFIAMAMQKWGLHERLALNIIVRTGTNPHRLVLGFMAATAFISMWMSNSATAMMMLPIGLAVIGEVAGKVSQDEAGKKAAGNFSVCVALGIAYAASIGGVGTLVGTPPNIVLVGAMTKLFPEAPRIGFGQWMLVGVPLVLILTPITWLLLTRVMYPVSALGKESDGDAAIRARLSALGPMRRAERVVMLTFCATALAWIFRADLELGSFTIPGWTRLLPNAKYVNDGTVAILFSLLLFIVPSGKERGDKVLDWDWALRIPWGVLLLFGGGFALAEGFSTTGLVEWAGDRLAVLSGFTLLATVLVLCTAVTFLSEVTSNTALSTIMLPILAATATHALGVHPLVLLIPATLSNSLAFMMPVGTPPNAIVFGSGCVTMPQMVRAGLVLNLVGIVVVTAITFLIVVPLFGIGGGDVPAWAR